VPTRRELLAAAALVAAGCRAPGSEPEGLGTIAADVGQAGSQRLDPVLRVSVPRDALDRATVGAFSRRTGVRVVVERHTSDLNLLAALAAAGDRPPFDAVLVEDDALEFLVAGDRVEPLERGLIRNRRLVQSPWDDTPADPGRRHSVVRDYLTVGFALAPGTRVAPPASWEGFFALASEAADAVAVPAEPAVVVGAAMVASGRSWNGVQPADIAAARDVLAPLAASLAIEGTLERPAARDRPAVLAASTAFARADGGSARFVVPVDGSITRARSWCIPVYSRAPVSAHAWFDFALDPASAAAGVRFSGRASPVGEAGYLLEEAILADPAVFAPRAAVDGLTFEDLPSEARDARAELWAELFEAGAGR
jgi:putrescine transport system substrate-binding protein